MPANLEIPSIATNNFPKDAPIIGTFVGQATNPFNHQNPTKSTYKQEPYYISKAQFKKAIKNVEFIKEANAARGWDTGNRLKGRSIYCLLKHYGLPIEVVTPESPVFSEKEGEEEEEEEDDDDDEEEDDSIFQLDTFDIPTPETFPDLNGIITADWSIEHPKSGIMDWIEAVHRRSRGLDLGSLGPSILPDVFREQSAKWETIAKQYLSKIILLVHRFILTALEVVCADSQVLQNVSSAILSDLCTTYESSMNQATFLVNVERQLKPYTLNHYFNHSQQRSYGVRIQETLRPKARCETTF